MSTHLIEYFLSSPCSSSSWHMAKHQTSLLMLKRDILRRDQCLCVRVKRTIKQNIPISFLLLHSLLLYPFSSLQTNWDEQSASRQIKDERSIFWQRDGMAQLFGPGLSGILQSGWVDGSKINKYIFKKSIQMNYELAPTVLSLAVTRQHWGG